MNKDIGTCDCGEIEFEIKGEPINTAFCYCTSCQLHTNSDKWFGVWVKKEAFEFVKGTPNTFVRKGDSGKNLEHKFCGNCGTTLAIFVEIGNFYSVAASTLKNKNAYSPAMLIYTKNAVEWAVYPEGIPKFDVLPPEMMG